jgi:DNA-binding transcriptional ArsR family regulator
MHRDIPGFCVPDSSVVDQTCEVLRILSDPTRLRLLHALSQGESSVACLAEIIGANPTAVSQHLSKLRLSGVVKARREGTFMYYTVIDPRVRRVLNTVLDELSAPTDADAATHV